MKQEEKTNVMRILEQKKVAYIPHGYEHDDGVAVDAVTVASLIGKPAEEIYKTLVLKSGKGLYFVFVIPGPKELDLKKAAKCAGTKSVAMLKVEELLPITGYVRGGCSPIGMKKAFPTFFDESALLYPTITVSAGKIGRQVEVSPTELIALSNGITADLCRE